MFCAANEQLSRRFVWPTWLAHYLERKLKMMLARVPDVNARSASFVMVKMGKRNQREHGVEGKITNFSLAAPKGFLAGTAACGLKKKGGEDLAIIFSERTAVAAAVFTRNLVVAAPVLLSRKHLRHETHRAIVVNSGGANACTG